MEKSKVYFTKEISSASLVKIYEALNVSLKGKIRVKISTREKGGHNFLNAFLINDLVNKLDGTIIECSTAYGGKRQDPKDHWQVIKEHGFKGNFSCDVLDKFAEFSIPAVGGALKNMSIGLASHHGMLNIHSAGKIVDQKECWNSLPSQDDFLENVVDVCKSIIDYVKKVYINIANSLSIDCDCSSNHADLEMKDIGIFASLDPVSID